MAAEPAWKMPKSVSPKPPSSLYTLTLVRPFLVLHLSVSPCPSLFLHTIFLFFLTNLLLSSMTLPSLTLSFFLRLLLPFFFSFLELRRRGRPGFSGNRVKTCWARVWGGGGLGRGRWRSCRPGYGEVGGGGLGRGRWRRCRPGWDSQQGKRSQRGTYPKRFCGGEPTGDYRDRGWWIGTSQDGMDGGGLWVIRLEGPVCRGDLCGGLWEGCRGGGALN